MKVYNPLKDKEFPKDIEFKIHKSCEPIEIEEAMTVKAGKVFIYNLPDGVYKNFALIDFPTEHVEAVDCYDFIVPIDTGFRCTVCNKEYVQNG